MGDLGETTRPLIAVDRLAQRSGSAHALLLNLSAALRQGRSVEMGNTS
jgi:hypothetical protein